VQSSLGRSAFGMRVPRLRRAMLSRLAVSQQHRETVCHRPVVTYEEGFFANPARMRRFAMPLRSHISFQTARTAKAAVSRWLLCAFGFMLSCDIGLAAGAMCNEHLKRAIRDQTALAPTEIAGTVGAIGDQREWLQLTDECGSLRVNLEEITVPQSCKVGSHATVMAFTDAGDLQDSIGVSGEPWVEAQNDRISCR
jgi:hypothetical protein